MSQGKANANWSGGASSKNGGGNWKGRPKGTKGMHYGGGPKAGKTVGKSNEIEALDETLSAPADHRSNGKPVGDRYMGGTKAGSSKGSQGKGKGTGKGKGKGEGKGEGKRQTHASAERSTQSSITFYEELGIPRDADSETIKQAWRKKCLETHPDKCTDPEEKQARTEQFKRYTMIYHTLKEQRSRALYDGVHLKVDRCPHLLVLIDMNGSLLFKANHSDLKTKRYSSVCGREPDWKDKDNGFYVRPYAKELLDAMLRPGSRLAFAIYTSRQPQNAMPQVQALGEMCGRPDLHEELFAIYAGDRFSIPDPAAGKFKSKRSLPRIWRDRDTCDRIGFKLNECNTLNLDNEARKLQDHPENGILVPSYGLDEVQNEPDKRDESLLSLRNYLLQMEKECHGDVRDYLRYFPFSAHSELRARQLPGLDQLMADEMASLALGK